VVRRFGKGEYVPIDSTRRYFTQTRGHVIVDTGKYGMVALIAMSIAQMFSVNFEDDVMPGITYEKGDMLGNFFWRIRFCYAVSGKSRF